MFSEFPSQPQNLTHQKQYLHACFNLPTYDTQVERVFCEVNRLFASQELQQRLLEKRQPFGKRRNCS